MSLSGWIRISSVYNWLYLDSIKGRRCINIYRYCGSRILALEFFISFSLLILLGQATAGAHCKEKLWPLNRLLSRQEAAEKSFDLSTGQLSKEFWWSLIIAFADLVLWGCALTGNLNSVFYDGKVAENSMIFLISIFLIIDAFPPPLIKESSNFSTRILNPPFQY